MILKKKVFEIVCPFRWKIKQKVKYKYVFNLYVLLNVAKHVF